MTSPASHRLAHHALRLFGFISLLIAIGCSKGAAVKGSKYMGRGDDAIAKGRIRAAIVCFEKEVELNPDERAMLDTSIAAVKELSGVADKFLKGA